MPPRPGQHAPDFTVDVLTPKLQVEKRYLQDFQQYVVLMFYPADFTFICPTEIQAFSDSKDRFQDSKAVVLMGSTDSIYCHQAFALQMRKNYSHNLQLDLFSDQTHALSKAYGVLDESIGRCMRAAFIIDSKKTIRHVTISGDDVARSVEECLRVLQCCQFADKNKGVLPCGIAYNAPDEELDRKALYTDIAAARQWIADNFEEDHALAKVQ